jgi:indolepyruvate ferredoxin oxidoreductase alpha subunit
MSHSLAPVESGERLIVPLREYKKDINKYVMMPGMAKKRHIVVEKRQNDIKAFADTLAINHLEYRDRKIGVIASGIAYQYVREALPDASTLKLGMVYPLPEKLIREFAANVEKLYVVEELEPFFENQIKAMGIAVIGKELFTVQGEYSVNMVRECIGGEKAEVMDPGALPQRPPVMCPGCPHRAVFYTIKKLGLTATGDIGCYTLGALPPLQGIDTCVCMGASIGAAMGMEKARGKQFARKLVAVIGDSTFFHSGITGLIDMVYNGATSTVIILDNSTTGMTGHQQHPGTGKNIRGEIASAVDIPALIKAIGVKNIRIVDPFDVKTIEQTLKEETAREELSVVIARRPCVLLNKKSSDSVCVITDKCKKCGVCMKLGCPAIVKTESGMHIDASLCTACGLCAGVCAFGAIETAGK